MVKIEFNSLIEAINSPGFQIQEFDRYYAENPKVTHNHPVFGPLNQEEWAIFHRKHFTHHLAQFGLISD